MVMTRGTFVRTEEEGHALSLRKRLEMATTPQVFSAEDARLLGWDLSGYGEGWENLQGKYTPDKTYEAGGYWESTVRGYTYFSDESITTPEGVHYASIDDYEWAMGAFPMEGAALASAMPAAPPKYGGKLWWESEEEYEERVVRIEGALAEPQPVNPLAGTPYAGYGAYAGAYEYRAPETQQPGTLEQAGYGSIGELMTSIRLAIPGLEDEVERQVGDLLGRLEQKAAGRAWQLPKSLEESDLPEWQQRLRAEAGIKPYEAAQQLPAVSFPTGTPEEVIRQLGQMAQDNPDRFADMLGELGKSDDTRMLLKIMTAGMITDEEIDNIFTSVEALKHMGEVIRSVDMFKDITDTRGFLSMVYEDPEKFKSILGGGRWTPEEETLTRMLFPDMTREDIYEMFKGEYDEGMFGEVWHFFQAGIGNLLSATSGAVKWLGYEAGIKPLEDVEIISELANYYRKKDPPDESLWGDLVRTTPFFLSLIPAMVIGWAAGGAVAGAVGLGRLGTVILEAIGAGGFSRSAESALEAGSTYEEWIARGMSPEEASAAAGKIFTENLKLVGMDVGQFFAMFVPIPGFRVAKSLITKGLLRTAVIGGRMVVVAPTEAFEEYYQEIVKRQVRGEDISTWSISNLTDKELQHVMIIGGIFGGVMAGFGDVMTTIQKSTIKSLPADLKQKFNSKVADRVRAGLSRKQAEKEALDMVAETEEGQKVIQDVMDTLKVELYRGQIKGENEIDASLWQKRLDNMLPEGIVGIPSGTVQAVQAVRAELGAEETFGFEATYQYRRSVYKDANIEIFVAGRQPELVKTEEGVVRASTREDDAFWYVVTEKEGGARSLGKDTYEEQYSTEQEAIEVAQAKVSELKPTTVKAEPAVLPSETITEEAEQVMGRPAIAIPIEGEEQIATQEQSLDQIAQTKFGKNFDKLNRAETIKALSEYGEIFVTSDMDFVKNKAGQPNKGFDSSSLETRPALLFGGMRVGVTTDGHVMVIDRQITDEVLGRELEKLKKKEVKGYIEIGKMTHSEATEIVEEKQKGEIESSKFPDYEQLIPQEENQGTEVRLIGVKYSEDSDFVHAYLWNGERVITVNANKLSFILKHLPDATIYGSQPSLPLTVKVGNKVKAVIMPLFVGDDVRTAAKVAAGIEQAPAEVAKPTPEPAPPPVAEPAAEEIAEKGEPTAKQP